MTDLFALWRSLHHAPFHFPMSDEIWSESILADVDSDGRKLFDDLVLNTTDHGMIQYGRTAFGFDQYGEVSDGVHYPVIRFLNFDPLYPQEGQQLLDEALRRLGSQERIYAFFHYFGMSACARHGKLHEKDAHVEELLLNSGFIVEHENVYYSKRLTSINSADSVIEIRWKPMSAGACRDFAALHNGTEVGWGQVHFLPQGDIAYLRWIYIDERLQHQGLGTETMGALCSSLFRSGIRRFDTDTALDNIAAQKYYEKTGFHNDGITRSYFTK